MAIALTRNRLIQSPHYAEILHTYNDLLRKKGKVNKSEFYREHIKPVMPSYSLQAFCQFINRYETTAGLVFDATRLGVDREREERALENNLLSNHAATAAGIQRALNIGMQALEEIEKGKGLMSTKERADFLFKAMKAQDSRIHALGKVREDSREQMKFDRAFGESSFDDDPPQLENPQSENDGPPQ